MDYLKASWKKDKKELVISKEVLDKMGARGSFVTVKSDRIFKDLNDKSESKDYSKSGLSIAEQINQKTGEIYFKMWMDNLAMNISNLKKFNCISKLPKATKKAAIVVGAGPSFTNKNHIKLLKKVKNISIFTTDLMLIPLLKAGITPDYVVSIDGLKKVADLYKDPLVNKKISTKAIFAVTVAPEVPSVFPGDIYFYTPMVDDINQSISATNAISYLSETSVIESGGNVGISCINIAYYLGYKNIICVGLDLGYSTKKDVEESSHYIDIKEEDSSMNIEKYMDLFVIEGYNTGFKVKYYTDLAWKPQIDNVLERAKKMFKEGVNIINATEGGALHGEGITYIKLDEAIKKYE